MTATDIIEVEYCLEYCEVTVEGGGFGRVAKYDLSMRLRLWFVPGHLLEREGLVSRLDFHEFCRSNGLREPSALEALLTVTKGKYVSWGHQPLVMFVGGSRDAYFASEDVVAWYVYRFVDGDFWPPNCLFLAVCE